MVGQSLSHTKLFTKILTIAILCIFKENSNPLPYIAIPENDINPLNASFALI